LFWGKAIDDFVIDPLAVFIEEYFEYWVRMGRPLTHPVIDNLDMHLETMDFNQRVTDVIFNVCHLAVTCLYGNPQLNLYIAETRIDGDIDHVTVDCKILPDSKNERFAVLLHVKEVVV
jgi:hypothetical protein